MYIVVTVGVAQGSAIVESLNVEPGLHEYEVPPLALSCVESPRHIPALPLIVIVGGVTKVTVTKVESCSPPESVTNT